MEVKFGEVIFAALTSEEMDETLLRRGFHITKKLKRREVEKSESERRHSLRKNKPLNVVQYRGHDRAEQGSV